MSIKGAGQHSDLIEQGRAARQRRSRFGDHGRQQENQGEAGGDGQRAEDREGRTQGGWLRLKACSKF